MSTLIFATTRIEQLKMRNGRDVHLRRQNWRRNGNHQWAINPIFANARRIYRIRHTHGACCKAF